MSAKNESKFKSNRRLGVNIWGDPKSSVNVRASRPGEHGKSRRRKVSGYAVHLNEKQKLQLFYLMAEKQFQTAFKKAYKSKKNVVETFIGNLERRLDAIVFRAKFAPTPFAAKQMIKHKHILVNGKIVNISSYLVNPDDVISIHEKIASTELVNNSLSRSNKEIPTYYEVLENGKAVRFIKTPVFEEVVYPFPMNPLLIVEFYARKV